MTKKKVYPPQASQEPQMQAFNAEASLNYLSQKLASAEKETAIQVGLASALKQELSKKDEEIIKLSKRIEELEALPEEEDVSFENEDEEEAE